jgi:hypothetical protein
MKKLRTTFNKTFRKRRKSKSSPKAASGSHGSKEKEREFHREAEKLLARNPDSEPGMTARQSAPELK